MKPEITAVVVIIVVLAGAFAALSGRQSRTEGVGPSQSPRWRIVAHCSTVFAVAVAAFTFLPPLVTHRRMPPNTALEPTAAPPLRGDAPNLGLYIRGPSATTKTKRNRSQ